MSKIFRHISRLLLGFIFLVAGLNGSFVILGFEPFIATSPEAMTLFEFKYLLILEKTIEIICGLLLLISRFVPLTLIILSPIVANILLFHVFLDQSLLPLAVFLVLIHSYLLFLYRKNFKGIFEINPHL